MIVNDDKSKPIVLRREANGKMPVTKLEAKLKEIQAALPKEKDGSLHRSVIIGARNRIPYDEVIRVMDTCKGLKLEGLVVNMETDTAMKPLVDALQGGGG
jgi:biopolymer transport protein ExbD